MKAGNLRALHDSLGNERQPTLPLQRYPERMRPVNEQPSHSSPQAAL